MQLDRLNFTFFPGFVSYRNKTEGSCFVQALCFELQDKGTSDDILSILTCVKRRVAIDYESYNPDDSRKHEKKQMPYVEDTLTRWLFFTRK
jgi:hypothetical protein